MKILNIKKTAILSLALMIGSANAGILNSISKKKKVSNAGNTVEQKFELKKKYEKAKAFVKKHKKSFIAGTAATVTIGAMATIFFGSKYAAKIRAENKCAICISEFDHEFDLKKLGCKCNAFYHFDCINGWLQQNPICPMCKNHSLWIRKFAHLFFAI